MANWFTKRLDKYIDLKHEQLRTLNNLSRGNLANGNLTILGFGNSAGQATDETILQEGYESNASAYSVINMVGETGSNIPWISNIRKPDGTLEPTIEGKFHDFVMNPNEDQTMKEFKLESYIYFLSSGDLFWHKPDIVGFAPSELVVKESQLMEVLRNMSAPLTPTGYKFQLGMLKETFLLNEIIHQKYINPTTKGIESLRGMSPFNPGWNALSADNQRAIAQESSMRNRGAAGFLSNESDTLMQEEDRKSQQSRLDKMFGGALNFARVIVAKSKAKFHQIGMSPADLQLLKTEIQNLRTFCNLYSAPSELFNDPANKTFANRKAALTAFYEFAVLPIDNRMLSKFNRNVVSDWSRFDKKDYVVTQDLSGIAALQSDKKVKAEQADKIITSISKAVAQMNQGLSPDAAAEMIAFAHDMSIEESKKFVILKKTNEPTE